MYSKRETRVAENRRSVLGQVAIYTLHDTSMSCWCGIAEKVKGKDGREGRRMKDKIIVDMDSVDISASAQPMVTCKP
jgi:hypothetical protein